MERAGHNDSTWWQNQVTVPNSVAPYAPMRGADGDMLDKSRFQKYQAHYLCNSQCVQDANNSLSKGHPNDPDILEKNKAVMSQFVTCRHFCSGV